MLPTNGDGSAYIKYSDGSVLVGAGGTDKINVDNKSVTINPKLTVNGDLSVDGGLSHTFVYTYLRTLQGGTPVMTGSVLSLSGTEDAGHGVQLISLRYPMRKAGSVLGWSLYSPDGTVNGGALTGTLRLGTAGNTPSADSVLKIGTGSVGSVNFAKDLITFSANDLLSVQLTASADYTSDVAASCSWVACVTVEM